MHQSQSHDNRYLCTLVSNGTGSPLFLVPSAGMTPFSLIQLARAVDPKTPIYSFNYAGTDDNSLPHNSYKEMAKDYVAEIRRLQPSGPYYVGGHCLGGIVALEIVTQLEVLNEKVSILVLLDTPAPQIPVVISEKICVDQSKADELGEHITHAIQIVYESAVQQFAQLPSKVVERFWKLLGIQIEAGLHYRYLQIEANTALLRSNMHNQLVYQNWRTICKGVFSEIEVSGDSFSMLKPPHVGMLGKQIGDVLQKL